MLLCDTEIRELISVGVLSCPGAVKPIGPVSYDLTTKAFYEAEDKELSRYVLDPGDSVFVGSEETIALPNDLACRVLLKNSRMREGLSLDAPLYFPGHKTRIFFRVTNVSANRITLDTRKDLASVAFERLSRPAESPYSGAFSNEFDFSNMASYKGIYDSEIEALERKADDVLGIERRLYGNVMTLMAVFVGIFSLVDVNLIANYGKMEMWDIVALNLATVGSIGALFGFMSLLLNASGKAQRLIPWIVAAIAFVCSGAIIALT